MSPNPEPGRVSVSLQIPAGMPFQLVYRQERTEPTVIPERSDCSFLMLVRPTDIAALAPAIQARLGWAGLARAGAKLATRGRLYYCLISGRRVVSDGWLAVSFCRYYRVEPGDVVIGPVWTDPAWRGRGLATYGLARAMDTMRQRGHSVFFIDTSNDNEAMQRAIARCGFGAPLAVYIRGRRSE